MGNNVKDFVTAIAVSTLISALSINKGIKIYDDNINHLSEYCLLNDILGVEHQINKINEEYGKNGIKAYEVKDNKVILKSCCKDIIPRKSGYYYKLPDGYRIIHGELEREVNIDDEDVKIVITSGEVIPFDDENEINIYDPQIINYVRKLKK